MIKKLLLCLVVLFSFNVYVNAACNDEELNEWATTVEPKFIEMKELNLDSSKYAYLLTITNLRDDIVLKVYDGAGKMAKGEMLYPSSTEAAIQAVGCYTNTEEEIYTIEVYGSKNSACANELLKTMKYTVPGYNRYFKDRRCENSDLEICQTFTASTKNMTQEDFNKAIEKEIKENESKISNGTILGMIIEYGLYVLVPLILISVIYTIRIGKYKKEERDR